MPDLAVQNGLCVCAGLLLGFAVSDNTLVVYRFTIGVYPRPGVENERANGRWGNAESLLPEGRMGKHFCVGHIAFCFKLMGATLNKPIICFLAFREFKTENHSRPHCLATKTGALSLLIGFVAAFRRVAPFFVGALWSSGN